MLGAVSLATNLCTCGSRYVETELRTSRDTPRRHVIADQQLPWDVTPLGCRRRRLLAGRYRRARNDGAPLHHDRDLGWRRTAGLHDQYGERSQAPRDDREAHAAALAGGRCPPDPGPDAGLLLGLLLRLLRGS